MRMRQLKENGNRYNRKEKDEIDIIELDLTEKKTTKSQVKSPDKKQKKSNNREFIGVTYFFVIIFLAMMGYLVYFHLIKSDDIINSSYNVRLDSMADRVVRGEILDNAGNVLAQTEVSEDGTEVRKYPYGSLYAHVVGYDSHGKSGLESVENFSLLTSHAFFVEQIMNEFQEEKNIGDNIITTLDTTLQKAAYSALGNYKGAVIVTQASTGKILAMVSKPDFDPNNVAQKWDELTSNQDSVLLNRATQGAYAPGSVFKLVTTLAYMRENSQYQNYSYHCEGEIEYEGTIIHCAKNRIHGDENMMSSLANSCNTSYSNIGLSLNLEKYKNTAENLLFNSKLPCPLNYRQSDFKLSSDAASYEIMMTAIGQGETQVSPYHMMLITSAIANGGILMQPYLVDQIVNYTGTVVEKNMPQKYTRLMTVEEAAQLKKYMQAVVENGTASSLNGLEYTVAGKTGTAEYSSDKEKAHSWFTGFTNVDNPDLVISVVVESADNSGMSAVTVAKKVLNAYYQ